MRIVETEDGRELIQLRIELGVIQMELEGRPDGVLQDGYKSLLELLEERGSHGGLEPDICRRLREEGVQRSHRAAALFALCRWDDVIRDCNDNLALFDVCRENALEESDREALEQFRGSVIALSTRAAAERAIEDDDLAAAMGAIDAGLEELKIALGAMWEQSNETQLLLGMKEAMTPKLPPSQRADIKERLSDAVAAENFELAAILRDELRLLKD
ncbi:MAG: UvrB/UvrC motif-containing protein [Planctomycetota bacterium]|nr:UvrB/UvrC motif-containing protein [Planctomycetota bacterium]